MTQPIPFVIHHDPAAIDDLRARLRNTRWPDDGFGWEWGTDVGYLRELVEFWADGYDFAAREARLATTPRYRVELDGLGIHAIHVPAARGNGIPLLLCHGWPDGTWRYEKVIDLLTNPDEGPAFDVVIPDMPGFGYSDKPRDVLDSRDVAALWVRLMAAFGYERFTVAGGDIGSHVSRDLGLEHPERLIAIHRMDAGIPRHPDPSQLTGDELALIQEAQAWIVSEGVYAQLHRTKPQTLAVGLSDSPAGLASWLVEKLRAWSDCGGDLESVYTKSEILDLLSTYWFTNTIDSSIRMYRTNGAIDPEYLVRHIDVPSGFSVFAGEIIKPPRAWLDRVADVVSHREIDRGGHFAPYEVPELYAAEVRDFFARFDEHTEG
ncbi:pimeloyl-ACP methyl ester carboxylesterase [Microbacteriaceae bacterium SG_E_30_P1]|uniref:Pimeloyl-ACP methyl ester carboxylesterase n=1 Tax=Antiquaquibacter oligotrophicus TaxID=2880260 RepID=A0ABT6KQZ8_9MICO|nr:epoxide hydrolase family protein [Antiquaquibacter oligotrophicus]MDH6182406.1 pimeloyl-ACP methyl ester carboxylesterase [Antiquaquibacter oligotrophicus]UDF14622.1 epoxide hydrolase [Antiquaquibacter oligotrophicus]